LIRSTPLLQEPHRRAPLVGRLHAHAERPIPGSVVEDRPGRKNPRTEDRTGRRGLAHAQDVVERRAHVTDAGHAVGDVERQPGLAARLGVRVHVPEAGNQECASRVDDLCECGGRAARRHAADGALLDDHRAVGFDPAGGDVDDADSCNGQRAGLRREREREADERGQQRDCGATHPDFVRFHPGSRRT